MRATTDGFLVAQSLEGRAPSIAVLLWKKSLVALEPLRSGAKLTKLKALPALARRDPRREPDDLNSGDIVAARYRLEDVLGRGGMGEVWSAFDKKLGRRVAIKMITFTGRDRAERGRFEREASLTKQLRGPSFVEVFDHGFSDDQAYLVMELLDGETLQQRLQRVGKLSLDETVQLVRGVGVSLRLAHALQIVHRDLKPGNIFFARPTAAKSGVQTLDGNREIIKLFDFGIAKDTWDSSRLTNPGVMLGSAHYMSPEQIRSGRDVDSRSDLWSLAVILFRTLTGERPFAGAAPDALANILNEEPPRVTSIDKSLPRTMDAFFQRAFLKEPKRRFQTIDELAEAFAAAARGESIDAARESLPGSRRSVLAAIDRLGVSSRPPKSRAVPPPLPPSARSDRSTIPAPIIESGLPPIPSLRPPPPLPRIRSRAPDAAPRSSRPPSRSLRPGARPTPPAAVAGPRDTILPSLRPPGARPLLSSPWQKGRSRSAPPPKLATTTRWSRPAKLVAMLLGLLFLLGLAFAATVVSH